MRKGKFLNFFKARNALSIISVAIGVASVIIIGYISDTGSHAINTELDNLGIDGMTIYTNSGVGNILTTNQLNTIIEHPSVKTAEPLMLTEALISIRNEDVKTTILAINEDPSIMKFELLYGRQFYKQDIGLSKNVCIIDCELAKSLYKRENIVGKILNISLGGRLDEYEIVGVVKSASGIMGNISGNLIPSFIYIPYTTYQNVNSSSTIDSIAVKIDDNGSIESVKNELIRNLELSTGYRGIFETQDLASQRETLQNLLSIVTIVLSAIGGISLLVSGLGIMTVMLVSVTERTREIGIKKAIGAKNANILFEFITEAFLIALSGTVIGIAFGTGLFFIGSLLINTTFFFSIERYLLSLVIAVFIGCIFGAYPAYKAAKLKPVEALRHE